MKPIEFVNISHSFLKDLRQAPGVKFINTNFELMAKTQRLQLDHTLSSDFDLIYQILLDFRKFGKVHDYITDVKIIADMSPEYIEYRVYEEIYLLGFLKNKPVYDVKVYEIEKNTHIRYVSQIKKNIELVIDLKITLETRSRIDVQEIFQVKASYFIAKLFLIILKKAHLNFFENLRRLLRNSIEDIPFSKQELNQK